MRAKLGGPVPILRLTLPRDLSIEVEGRFERSFAAMELGGLTLEATRLDVREGWVKLSFAEPLARPMQSLTIEGNKGGIAIGLLGNASPAEVRIDQFLGAVDLDLRGAWSRDADISVEGRAAGGSLWLPRGVRIEGIEAPGELQLDEEGEMARPTLSIELSERLGRFVVID